MYILGLTLTGIISGIFAGLIGSGAEILIVPLLTFFGVLSNIKLTKDNPKGNYIESDNHSVIVQTMKHIKDNMPHKFYIPQNIEHVSYKKLLKALWNKFKRRIKIL